MKHILSTAVAVAFLGISSLALAGDPAQIHKATYSGIIGVGGAPSDQGGISIKTTAEGQYTVAGKVGKKTFRHKGEIQPGGTVDETFEVKLLGGLIKFEVQLVFALSPDGEKITGTVKVGDTTAPFELHEAFPYTKDNPATQAGTFTAVFRTDVEPFPDGSGVATVSVSLKGGVKVVGKLVDGSNISCGGSLSQAGIFPIFNILYGRKGALAGFGQFTTNSEGSSEITWVRLEGAKLGAAFLGSYSGAIAVNLQRYTKPAAGEPALDLGTKGNVAPLTLGSGGLGGTFAFGNVALGDNNKFAVSGENEEKLKLALNKNTGLIKGSIVLEIGDTTKKRPIYLAIRQLDKKAEGFFIGNGTSGTAQLGQMNN